MSHDPNRQTPPTPLWGLSQIYVAMYDAGLSLAQCHSVTPLPHFLCKPLATSSDEKVKALEPHVPTQHTFGGDGLQNFIQDHQEELERLSHQVENLMVMMNEAVLRLQVGQEHQHQDLQRAEAINAELLRRVVALEHGWENLIVIPDSPEALPVRPPFMLGPGSVLIPIDNDVDDERNQMIAEDQARVEEERQRLTAA